MDIFRIFCPLVLTSLYKVLTCGGSGFVGRHVERVLAANGFQCYILTRNRRSKHPNAIHWIDINNKGLPDVDAVINLCGANILNPFKRWSETFKEEVRNSRINSSQYLANLIEYRDPKPKLYICMSGVAKYKPSETEEYTEDTACEPYDFLSQLTADWETAASIHPSVPVRHVTLRSGVVLGRDGGMIKQLYYPFFFGLGGRISTGKQWFPWIHVDDVAGICLHAIKNDNVNGVLNAVAPQVATNSDFTQAFAGALRRPALFPVPAFCMSLVFGQERGKVILEGQKVIPKRTLESGYEYKYPDLKSACASLV